MKQLVIISFATAFVLVCILHLLAYFTTQQVYRSYADQEQEDITYELSNHIRAGGIIDPFLFQDATPIENTRKPFLLFLDSARQILPGSAMLYGKPPKIPFAKLEMAKNKMHFNTTWNPAPLLRYALSIRYMPGKHPAYIIGGKSLWNTDRDLEEGNKIIAVSWVLCIVALGTGWVLFTKPNK